MAPYHHHSDTERRKLFWVWDEWWRETKMALFSNCPSKKEGVMLNYLHAPEAAMPNNKNVFENKDMER